MFRFTIRDVLWLTVVVVLAVGWGLEYRASWFVRAAVSDLLKYDSPTTVTSAGGTYRGVIVRVRAGRDWELVRKAQD